MEQSRQIVAVVSMAELAAALNLPEGARITGIREAGGFDVGEPTLQVRVMSNVLPLVAECQQFRRYGLEDAQRILKGES